MNKKKKNSAGAIPQAGIVAAIPVWQKVDWPPEVEQRLYRDWGKYYARRSRQTTAMHYYDKALEMQKDDYMCLYNHSQSNRQVASTKEALADSTEARGLALNLQIINAPINLEQCDCLYELNQLENTKAKLHDNLRLFKGNKIRSFENRLVVIDENIIDTCGEGLGPFILENEKLMYHVKDLDDQNKPKDLLLWKHLRDQGKCDILSIPEIEEVILSSLEKAKRRRSFDIFNQVFIDKPWRDVLFLKNLRQNPNLLLEQCKNSRDILCTLLEERHTIVRKFLRMLYARSPMYYIRHKKHGNNEFFGKFREAVLYRIQYQTRRNMFASLRAIKQLRKEQDIQKLSKFVEEIMGNYVVLKTNRIMPWKFEFINEVYNTLALAIVEQYQVPKNFKPHEKNALLVLLHQHTDKSKDIPKFVFGDRTTQETDEVMECSLAKYRRRLARFERRMLFAKYSIEKCYILYQIADIHLKGNRHAECCFIARKAIEECRNCNNYVYKFLALMLIIKSNAALRKIEGVKDTLASAYTTARMLKCPRTSEFVELCINCNDRMVLKNVTSNQASRRSSKMSTRSSVYSTLS